MYGAGHILGHIVNAGTGSTLTPWWEEWRAAVTPLGLPAAFRDRPVVLVLHVVHALKSFSMRFKKYLVARGSD